MADYYPEGYRRKRQREQAYRKVGFVMAALVVIAGGIVLGAVVYRGWVAPRRSAPGATPQRAAERLQLETQEKLSDPERQGLNDGTVSAKSAENQVFDLAKLEYSPSFPAVKVALGDTLPVGDTPLATDAATAPAESTANSADLTADVTAPTSAQPAATVAKPADTAASNATTEPKTDTKPASKPNEDKKQEEKKPEKPKTEEQKKPAEQPKAEEKKPAAGSSGYQFKVYAGSATTREAAESIRNEVSATGVSGTVIKSGGDYLVLVATLEDYDAAMALKSKLASSGFSGAFATRKSK